MRYPTPLAGDWRGWVYPVPVWEGRVPQVTDGYSNDRVPTHRKHEGVDVMFPKKHGDPEGVVKHLASRMFIAPQGTPILAVGPGNVWSVGVDSYGHWILLDHGYVGPNAGGVTTRYAHLEGFSKDWKRGDAVKAGDILGLMGYPPGANDQQLRHLHFEIRFPRSGVPSTDWDTDPTPYMKFWDKVVR